MENESDAFDMRQSSDVESTSSCMTANQLSVSCYFRCNQIIGCHGT